MEGGEKEVRMGYQATPKREKWSKYDSRELLIAGSCVVAFGSLGVLLIKLMDRFVW